MSNKKILSLRGNNKPNKKDKPFKRERLSNLRLFASAYAEGYYIIQNLLDHVINFHETNLIGQKYLPSRMKEYKGQKKLAFLYHGYFQGTVGYERLERILESDLFNIFAVSGTYQPYSQDIRKSAEYEMRVLEWVLNNTDVEEVYLIGHSQGGLVVRYMIQFLGADKYVDKAIFLSTPHRGTKIAYASGVNKLSMNVLSRILPNFKKIEGESGKQLRPNSQFIRRLNSKNLPKNVDYTSIYTYIDPIVWPASNARLPYREANNILLRKIGHMQTLYDFQAIELILKTILLGKPFNDINSEGNHKSGELYEKRNIKRGYSEFNEFVTY